MRSNLEIVVEAQTKDLKDQLSEDIEPNNDDDDEQEEEREYNCLE